MSTLNVATIKNGATANITLDTAGNATVGGSLAMSSSFLRNKIINGGMRLDQRNAGASVTPTASAYTLDRWSARMTQASKYSVVQSTTVPNNTFTNSLLATSASAYSVLSTDAFNIQQIIEGFNSADLAWGTADAKAITLSFWARSSISGTNTYAGALRNDAGTQSYIFTYTLAANTWTYVTITVPGSTSGSWVTNNGAGLYLTFSLGTGSNFNTTAGAWQSGNYLTTSGATSVVGTSGATFYITGVQLEVGSIATPFERRQYGTELALCQRYYYQIRPGVTGEILASGSNSSTTVGRGTLNFPVEMRIAPTALQQSGTANQYAVFQLGIGATTCSAVPSFTFANTRLAIINATVASGLTQFNPCTVSTDATNGATAYLGWSAEL